MLIKIEKELLATLVDAQLDYIEEYVTVSVKNVKELKKIGRLIIYHISFINCKSPVPENRINAAVIILKILRANLNPVVLYPLLLV